MDGHMSTCGRLQVHLLLSEVPSSVRHKVMGRPLTASALALANLRSFNLRLLLRGLKSIDFAPASCLDVGPGGAYPASQLLLGTMTRTELCLPDAT